jgi:hypothetical protein
MIYSCREDLGNIMRQGEAADKARGKLCAESEGRKKLGKAKAGLDSQIGFFQMRAKRGGLHKLLKNQAGGLTVAEGRKGNQVA